MSKHRAPTPMKHDTRADRIAAALSPFLFAGIVVALFATGVLR